MNVLAKTQRSIERFFEIFEEATVVGLVLPTGWFGRPYDNYYHLNAVSIDSESGAATIDLDHEWILVIRPQHVAWRADHMELTIRVSNGVMRHLGGERTFGEGDVKFCVLDTPYARKALDEIDPDELPPD